MGHRLLRLNQRRPHPVIFLLVLILGFGLSIASFSAALIFALSGLIAWLLAPLTISSIQFFRRRIRSFRPHRESLSLGFSLLAILVGFFLINIAPWLHQSQVSDGPSVSPTNAPPHQLTLPPLAVPPQLSTLSTRIADSEIYLLQVQPTAPDIQTLSVSEGVVFNVYDLSLDELWRLLFVYQAGLANHAAVLASWQATLASDDMLKQLEPQLKTATTQFLDMALSTPRFRMPSNVFNAPTLLEIVERAFHNDPEMLVFLHTVDSEEFKFLYQPPTKNALEPILDYLESIGRFSDIRVLYDAVDELDEEATKSVAQVKQNFRASAADDLLLHKLNQNKFFLLGKREIPSWKRGLLLREASFPALPVTLSDSLYCWRDNCPKTKIELSSMPLNSFYAAQDAKDLDVLQYVDIAKITWSVESPNKVIKFAYLPPPYQNLRFFLTPFLNFSYRSNWFIGLIGIGIMLLLGSIVRIANAAMEALLQDLFKSRFQRFGSRIAQCGRKVSSKFIPRKRLSIVSKAKNDSKKMTSTTVRPLPSQRSRNNKGD